MLIDTQIIGMANANRTPAKHILNPITDRGMSIAQQKQGRHGRTSKLFNKLKQRHIQMNNPKHKTHPSIATTPRSPVPTRHPIRQIAPNNIEVRQIQINPKMIMKMRTTNSKRHSIAALIPIRPNISIYLSISLSSFFLFVKKSTFLSCCSGY
ncbi:MAG: hypothetical protein MASP_00533 [Candidatus Methanolliviera sp. GoM_asphalt]|nr:MAG: hypothetical protein MASP_00533 [Candidatus Methanolliviera sp. GoM_asphalt]